jgi:virginiamycin A acetyltransferase
MANILQKFFGKILFGKKSNLYQILKSDSDANLFHNKNTFVNSKTGNQTKLYPPFRLINSNVDDYTYIAENSILSNTNVGKFCSFGPNLISGWGLHPLNGISTHPMFYSTKNQNGITLSSDDKFEELKPIEIGNDVFIGMNVSIIDGVKIGHGAVIGAGAIVSKDIPPYAIAVGSPIQIKGYRFEEQTIKKLLELKWWDFKKEDLQDIERNFFNVEEWLKNQNV